MAAGPAPTGPTPKGAHPADPWAPETLAEDSRRTHELSTEDALAPRPPVATEYGGALYLLNLALALELYGDFTSPARPGIALPVWDFVEIVGRGLVGRKFDEDPLSPLLAALAGRSQREAPGRGFRPDNEWRLPSSWCVPFPERAGWTWSASRGRLAIRHPAGFLVADVATAGAGGAPAALERELARFGWPEASQHRWRIGRSRGSPVRRWSRRLLPYIRARLVRALGVAAEDVGSLVCAHAARIFVTPSHLDVCFALATLPIQIRLAGLDRDPGWIPAASRVIAFHYE